MRELNIGFEDVVVNNKDGKAKEGGEYSEK